MRPEIKRALVEYARDGRPLGHFLTAVLSNDLFDAVTRADEDNLRDLYEIAVFVHNELPAPCHGSPAKVKSWLQRDPDDRRRAALAAMSDGESGPAMPDEKPAPAAPPPGHQEV